MVTKRKLRFFWNWDWTLEQIEKRFGVQIYAVDIPKEINANIWLGNVVIFPEKGGGVFCRPWKPILGFLPTLEGDGERDGGTWGRTDGIYVYGPVSSSSYRHT
jgi:hypothetical protein